MPKSLRDTWKGYKDAMSRVGKDVEKQLSKEAGKDVQKKMDKILATFTGGFGPLLDKFEAAEKKADRVAMKQLQGQLRTVIQAYQANARREIPDVSGVPNNVVRQLGRFQQEIDRRAG